MKRHHGFTQSQATWAAWILCSAAALPASAQTFTSLVNFDSTNGAYPSAPVVQGTGGALYGTTYAGGSGSGEVFDITSTGALTVLYSFCQPSCNNGSAPLAPLALGTDGNFYGTTSSLGAHVAGTVFEITSGGRLTLLHSFCSSSNCSDGAYPQAGLVLSGDGTFYGTTTGGGANSAGVIFNVTPDGALTSLYAFCSQSHCTDGSDPQAGLALGTDGLFYGTTYAGGTARSCVNGCGTVFKVTPQGVLTTLYSFCSQPNCTDGDAPMSTLVQGRDGDFYGTTTHGGAHGGGTVFKITPGGTLTTIYDFCSQANCADGTDPRAGLVAATDLGFYGTTYSGGVYSNGAVFRISSGGKLTILHSFDSYDGQNPDSALLQATNGIFYGTTLYGGSSRSGTGFSLNMSLHAFVEPVPVAGQTGRSVIILGYGLTGTSRVTFNGVAASFIVQSDTSIKATVPAGASTGPVQVVTPGGTLTSNVSFRVSP